MSICQFLSSDAPLKEVDNTQAENLSIEEAEARNIPICDSYKKNMNISRTEKILLWFPSEESSSEIVISSKCYYNCAEDFSKKRYHAELNWYYSDKLAEQLIDYIKDHLKTASEIELWTVDVDIDDMKPIKERREVKMLTIDDIKRFNSFSMGIYSSFEEIMMEKRSALEEEFPYCLTVYKELGEDSIKK